MVLDFLDVDNFDFTRKIVKKNSRDTTKATKLQTLNFSAKNNQKEMSTYHYSSILLENQKLLTHTVVTR